MDKTAKMTRRRFLGSAAAGAAACSIVPAHVLGAKKGGEAPSDKLNIAVVGIGGRGYRDLQGVKSQNIVALCDVDEKRGAKAWKQFPKAKKYADFRKMLDEMDKEIDAVVVGTPDHTHAVILADAIARGKHVYSEKPLAHSVGEIRRLRELAKKHKVITQVGNQGHSSDRIRSLVEWVRDGAIGQVTEVHAACSAFKNVYCQINKLPELKKTHEIPGTLDWDLWLGPAKKRPYCPVFVPWNWRGWLPFGTGAIGDWICHVVDPAFWALDLDAPTSVLAEPTDYDPAKHLPAYPPANKVTFEFPAKGKRGPVTLIWYDGNNRIPHPDCLAEKRKVPGTGAILIGSEGGIQHGSHGAGGCRIIPEEKMKAYKQPEKTIPRVKGGHHQDWLDAVREGRQAGSSFEYGGPLTELALLGVIATRFPGQKLQWDAKAVTFTNFSDANPYLDPPCREGWSL